MKYPKFATTVMAGALALSLGLVGCGGTDTATTKEETAATEEVSAAEEQEATSEETAEATAEEREELANTPKWRNDFSLGWYSNLPSYFDGWTDAYVGSSTRGEQYYFAEDGRNGRAALLVTLPDSNVFLSYVGDITNYDENRYTITDSTIPDHVVSFQITSSNADGSMVIDLGGNDFATIYPASIEQVLDGFDYVYRTHVSGN